MPPPLVAALQGHRLQQRRGQEQFLRRRFPRLQNKVGSRLQACALQASCRHQLRLPRFRRFQQVRLRQGQAARPCQPHRRQEGVLSCSFIQPDSLPSRVCQSRRKLVPRAGVLMRQSVVLLLPWSHTSRWRVECPPVSAMQEWDCPSTHRHWLPRPGAALLQVRSVAFVLPWSRPSPSFYVCLPP